MIRALRCLWRGHDFYTIQFSDGRAFVPPCTECGASNSDALRWCRGYTEVHQRLPRPDEYPTELTGMQINT